MAKKKKPSSRRAPKEYSWADEPDPEVGGPDDDDDDDDSSNMEKQWDTASDRTDKLTLDVAPPSPTNSKQSHREPAPWCKRINIILFSSAFVAIYIYSAIDNQKRGGEVEWYLFYSFEAAVPVLFLMHYMLCFPVKLIYLFCFAMMIWSTVYVVQFSMDMRKSLREDAGDDEAWHHDMERLSLHLSWAVLGLFSPLYHAFASCCFVTKNQQEGNE